VSLAGGQTGRRGADGRDRRDGRDARSGVRPGREAGAGASGGSGLWVLVATILGSSLSFIDGTVVNVALPTLQRDLGATGADAQWVIEAYALFLAALILVGGSLGDRLGRRRIYAVGIAIFAASSVLCGLAPNVDLLIAGRAVQGIGGALLVPGSLAIISAYFDGSERGKAIGTWSGFTTVTSALGPLLGGWLVQNASWRWVFFINVPLAALTLAILFWRVPESRDERAEGHIDYLGAALATLGLIAAGVAGFGQPVVLLTLGGGVLALVLFLLAEARERVPMMPLGLFRSRTFSGANLLTLLLYGALGGALYFLPFDLQQVQGYSPLQAGAALLPFTIVVFALSRWTGGLVQRVGARIPLVVGPVIVAAGFALYTLPGVGGSYWTTFFPAVLVMSAGMALVIAPLTTTVMGAVAQQHSGVASGINNAVSRASGLLFIAVLGIVVAATFNNALDGHVATLHLAPAARHVLDTQRVRLAGTPPPPGLDAATRAAVKRSVAASLVSGFRVAMAVGAALALISALAALFMIEGKGKDATAGAGVTDPAHPVHAHGSASRRLTTGQV